MLLFLNLLFSISILWHLQQSSIDAHISTLICSSSLKTLVCCVKMFQDLFLSVLSPFLYERRSVFAISYCLNKKIRNTIYSKICQFQTTWTQTKNQIFPRILKCQSLIWYPSTGCLIVSFLSMTGDTSSKF